MGASREALWHPQNTVLVGVAQARMIEFDAKYPGDWMLHCHLPHHMMNQMVSMVGPMAHAGHGLQTGGGMEEGMGMVRKGNALSEDLGPSFGRGMGMAERERQVSNIVGTQSGHGQHSQHGGAAGTGKQKRVPGFPQDMWMVMDDEVAKPETYGMASGWTGAMQGMMTTVRVLPPDKYDDIMRRVREAQVNPVVRQNPTRLGRRRPDAAFDRRKKVGGGSDGAVRILGPAAERDGAQGWEGERPTATRGPTVATLTVQCAGGRPLLSPSV